jgi:hypothetical protein
MFLFTKLLICCFECDHGIYHMFVTSYFIFWQIFLFDMLFLYDINLIILYSIFWMWSFCLSILAIKIDNDIHLVNITGYLSYGSLYS